MTNKRKTINPEKVMEKIGWKPHAKQRQIINAYLSGKQKIVVSAGQRSGKSMVASFLVCLELLADNREILVISPSYSLTDRVMTNVRKWLGEFFNAPIQYTAKPFPRIEMPWGSYCEGKSAESPEQILGKSYNFICVDEASRIPRKIFEQYLFPRIGEKKGKMLMISTPLMKDWFYDEFMLAKQDNAGFQFGTLANPFYPKESYDIFEKKLPKAIFEREFLGVFTDKLTSIFPDLRNCINPDLPREPISGHFHFIGLDLAQQEDFTAIVVIDKENQEVIRTEKFQGISYPAQLQRILGIAQLYSPCRIIIDSRNIGAVISEQLRNEGVWVEDWTSTGTISKDFKKRGSKEKLVEKMIALFESRSIKIPNNQELLDELLSYTFILSDSNNIRYGVPSGLHDDLCDALFMACWNLDLRGAVRGKNAMEQKWEEMKERRRDLVRQQRSSDI